MWGLCSRKSQFAFTVVSSSICGLWVLVVLFCSVCVCRPLVGEGRGLAAAIAAFSIPSNPSLPPAMPWETYHGGGSGTRSLPTLTFFFFFFFLEALVFSFFFFLCLIFLVMKVVLRKVV